MDYGETTTSNQRDYGGDASQAGRAIPTRGPLGAVTRATSNRPMDASPIGQGLSALEESVRALHGSISRIGDRLEPVLNQSPDGGTSADKMREPVSVLERIAAAESLVRIAIARLEGLTERLLL